MGNLKNGNPDHILTTEEQRLAGIKSGETRRKKKQLREILDALLEREVGKDKDGNSITGAEAMALKAVKAAQNGDWKAWELVRDTAGQKPVEKVMVAEVEESVINEVEALVGAHGGKCDDKDGSGIVSS